MSPTERCRRPAFGTTQAAPRSSRQRKVAELLLPASDTNNLRYAQPRILVTNCRQESGRCSLRGRIQGRRTRLSRRATYRHILDAAGACKHSRNDLVRVGLHMATARARACV
jgi:hypothetical protein